MRYQEIYEKLEAADITKPFNNLVTDRVARELPELRTRLAILSGIPGFEELEQFLTQSAIYKTSALQVQLGSGEYLDLVGKFNTYIIGLRALHSYLKATLSLQAPDSIFIKLPETKEFKVAIADQELIAKSLEQVLLAENVNGKLDIRAWERGSLWIELAIGGPVLVGLVGSIAWSAAVVFKKIQEGKIHAEYARGLNLKNESLQNIVDAQAELLKNLVDTEARNISAEHLKGEAKPDTIERIKFCIKTLSELIGRGAEIHPALQAPEQVKNLFPNFRDLMKIESRTRMIKE